MTSRSRSFPAGLVIVLTLAVPLGTLLWLYYTPATPQGPTAEANPTATVAGLAAAAAAAFAVGWQRRETRRAQALMQDALAQQRRNARYQTILLSVGDAVISTDARGRVELLNPAAETLTGWTQAEANGLPLADIFPIVDAASRQPLEDPAQRVLREGGVTSLANHTVLIARNGAELTIADSGAPIRDETGAITGVVLVFRDVTRETVAERERAFSLNLLHLLNDAESTRDLLRALTGFLQTWTRCEAVGVRLRDGDDFPYYETRGYPAEFVQSESDLGARDTHGQPVRDEHGVPVLDGMCGNVLSGRFDPAQPFFTARGSFWTNSTTALLATTTERDRPDRMRNRCHDQGYESVALIRLRKGHETLGLLQINDHAPGRFSPHLVAFLEHAADQIAIALAEHQVQQALADGRAFLRALIDSLPDFVFAKDARGRFTMCNHAQFSQIGLPNEAALLGKTIFDFCPPDLAAQYHADDMDVIASGTPHINREHSVFTKAGDERRFLTTKVPLRGHDGSVVGLVGISRDVTEPFHLRREKSRIEEQFQQSQKMESVGRLAGGVAHDFNNMLQVILGNTEAALKTVAADKPLRDMLEQVQHAARRSADLTGKLLAFARRQTVQLRVLDLNDALADMLKMLQRLIGEHIDLAWVPGRDLWPVRIDPSQLDQVLTNLVVNARDAIVTETGRITIDSDNATLDNAYAALHADVKPGEFVCLAVSDNGVGMDAETRAHVFEPFFTTKKPGAGTGLGLATVYGIVKQNGGFVNVYSEPGQGTTFRIYLPRVHVVQDVAPATAEVAAPRGGTETVLLVEDEPAVLQHAQMTLAQLGYTVLAAAMPGAALQLAAGHDGPIHLLVTDVGMPEMNGRQLAARLTADRPGLHCLYISGYPDEVITHGGVLERGVCFLQKPFTVAALAAKVREAMERG